MLRTLERITGKSFSNSRLELSSRLIATRLCCSSKAREALSFSSASAPISATRDRNSTSSPFRASGNFLPRPRVSKTARRRAHGKDGVRSDAVIEQLGRDAGKALLTLDIGNGHRLLMFPCPPARRFIYGDSLELSTFLVLFPILRQHVILARVVQGKIQQFASRQFQHRGGRV